MGKYVGVSQDKNGNWFYRIKLKKPNGTVVDTRIKRDKDNKPFLSARVCYEAKREHEARIKDINIEEIKKYTLKQVYDNYLQTEAKVKANATLKKQDSMWRNHINDKFGDRDVNSITIVELNDFLVDLYASYAYGYVEAFLKFFYLLFGHADRLEVIDSQRYNRMFVNKGTRLTMPTMSQSDYEEELKEATFYENYELQKIAKVFDSDDGNLKLAFQLGAYAGLRISECFGLRWSCIDWANQTITVDRQLIYVNGEWHLSPVKTLTGVRTVLISDELFETLSFYYDYYVQTKERQANSYRDFERVYDEVKDEWFVGLDFVNRKQNGELLTSNSMKYWSKKIKSETGIDFQYHNLRHTFATRCAENNMNLHMLMQMMGHKKIDTTKKYYISTDSRTLKDNTLKIMNKMYKSDFPFNWFNKEE